MLLFPLVAYRDCEACRLYQHTEETGEILMERSGNKALRDKLTPVPCETDRGCPKGHWSNPVCTDQHMQTYAHFKRCQAVGRFPHDPIVEQNAGIISMQEERVRKQQEQDKYYTLLQALQVRGYHG
jgi:hypothetical protein